LIAICPALRKRNHGSARPCCPVAASILSARCFR
jgi:hypothetical protein